MATEAELIRWLRASRGAPDPREARDVGRPARDESVERVRGELRALGVRRDFRVVWAGDGSGVVPEEPEVIHIHRPLLRADHAPTRIRAAAERVMALDVANVLRHEIGHALLFARPAAARTSGFRRLYGDIRVKYRVGDPLDEVRRRMERHRGLANPRYRRVISLYAATHPHERFAEAVRIAMSLRGDEGALRRWAAEHDTDEVVAEQLVWAARWLKGYDQR